MIEISNVDKWYGPNFQALKDCTTRVAKGEVVVVCGPSGSGKSTLMRSVLLPAVKEALKQKRGGQRELVSNISGTEFFETVYEVDQSPIGKTSRSTPASSSSGTAG